MESTKIKNNPYIFQENDNLEDNLACQLAKAEIKITRQQEEINALKLKLMQTEILADKDPLVDIYNARALGREIKRAQVLMQRYDILSSLIYFDLNGFKKINDVYGHSFGDKLLISIGEMLCKNTRDCDVVARLGGDEFAVLLFKADENIAKAKASVLACKIAELKLELGGEQIGITTAWGVCACYPEDDSQQIIHRADRAMYLAKADKT